MLMERTLCTQNGLSPCPSLARYALAVSEWHKFMSTLIRRFKRGVIVQLPAQDVLKQSLLRVRPDAVQYINLAHDLMISSPRTASLVAVDWTVQVQTAPLGLGHIADG